MNDKRNFAVSVIVALIIPTLLGGIYFLDMSKIKGGQDYIAKLESNREIIILKDAYLNSIKNRVFEDKEYENSSMIEFEIGYLDGEDDSFDYLLKLSDVAIPEGLDGNNITWILQRFDDSSLKYDKVASGNFTLDRDNKIALWARQKIHKREFHQYRLYYFLNEKLGTDEKIYARIIVE